MDACPEAFYHTTESTCEPCSENCHVCTGPNHCLKCNSSYYVSDGVCVKLECGEGKRGYRNVYDWVYFLKFSYLQLLCDILHKSSRSCSESFSQRVTPVHFVPLSVLPGEVEDPDYEDCVACEEGCRKCVLCKSQFSSYNNTFLKCFKRTELLCQTMFRGSSCLTGELSVLCAFNR